MSLRWQKSAPTGSSVRFRTERVGVRTLVRPLRLRWFDIGFELIERFVQETARREVSRTGNQAGERQRRFVFRSHPGAPAIVFVAQDALARDLVGIGSDHAGRFKCPVEIDHQMMFRRSLGDFLVPVRHFLVIVIHKINFEGSQAAW